MDYRMKNGEKIYQETCISCHGKDGNSNTDMNLVVKPRVLSKSILNEKQLYYIIRDGSHEWGSKSDIMPGFKYVYNDECLLDVAYYIFNKFVKNSQLKREKIFNSAKIDDKGISLKLGRKIYTRNCSLCHGIDGIANHIANI